MPAIETLVDDIYKRLETPKEPNKDAIDQFTSRLSNIILARLNERRDSTSLRMSNLGTPCDRKLWYSINKPEWGEPLTGKERLKFIYGDVLEELLLFLAEESGHSVEHRQAEVEINGVKGRVDSIIDGRLTDVKSASSFSFEKFKRNALRGSDPFGYLVQLGAYLYGSTRDSNLKTSLKDKDVFSFLAIDKQSGALTLDTYPSDNKDYSKVVEQKRAMLSQSEPPPRGFNDEPEGASGNRKLCVTCSYCQFKHKCWPGLRTFAYSTGPAFLTKVVREPKVKEIT